MLFAHLVTRLGHEPVLASDAEGDIDAALIEPAVNGGLELAASLRGRHPDLPLVFVSIYPRSADAMALQPIACLLKPFHLSELEAALRAALAEAPNRTW